MICKKTYLATASAIRTNGLINVLAYLNGVSNDTNATSEKREEAKSVETLIADYSEGKMTSTIAALKKLRVQEFLAPQNGETKLFKKE